MQSNMFGIEIKNGDNSASTAIAKRIMPSELPTKKGGTTVYREFYDSAKREIDFYRCGTSQIYFSSGYNMKDITFSRDLMKLV